MRVLLTVLIILLGVIGTGIWIQHSLNTASDDMVKQIDLIMVDLKRQAWQKAEDKTSELQEMWREQSKWWPIVLHHSEIDNIEFSLAKATEYVESRDESLALGQLAELKLMVKHIPEIEAVTLQNIM